MQGLRQTRIIAAGTNDAKRQESPENQAVKPVFRAISLAARKPRN
jgi:hypothetical protein